MTQRAASVVDGFFQTRGHAYHGTSTLSKINCNHLFTTSLVISVIFNSNNLCNTRQHYSSALHRELSGRLLLL